VVPVKEEEAGALVEEDGGDDVGGEENDGDNDDEEEEELGRSDDKKEGGFSPSISLVEALGEETRMAMGGVGPIGGGRFGSFEPLSIAERKEEGEEGRFAVPAGAWAEEGQRSVGVAEPDEEMTMG
jgi:hypothetical protein